MPKFSVPILQDAWILHEAVVEADDKEQAAEIAYRAWKEGNDDVKFVETGRSTFYHIEYPELDDIEEIEDIEEVE
jgi:hypothetical protein